MVRLNKKADMSIQTIVVAVLALTVLIILIVIFKNQTGKAAGGFSLVGDDAMGGLTGKKCQTLLGDRVCEGKFNKEKYPIDTYKLIPLPSPTCTPDEEKKMTEDKTGKYNCKVWSDCATTCYDVTKI